MNKRRILAISVAIMMVFGSFSVSFADTDTTAVPISAEATFTDTSNHWGATAIEKWAGHGIIKGYEGLFRPEDPITRGEMAVILDNMMDYQETAANTTFTDLKAGQFYTEAVLKANMAGIIKGDGVTVRPIDKITREEAAVMMSRAFSVQKSDKTKAFADASAVSVWAKDAVFGMEAKGYVQGYGGYFNPKANIKRAEAVTMINNIVKAYYTEAGTYTKDVEGMAVIKVPDVILDGVTVSENLIIAEGVAQGDATLDSVTIKGDTVIRGGGENSVKIIGNSSVGTIRIEKVGDKLRVYFGDDVNASTVEVEIGEEIIIEGEVGEVQVNASDARVYAENAKITTATISGNNSTIIVGAKTTIKTVNVATTAQNTNIQTEKGAVVTKVTAASPVTVSGTGDVSDVTLNEGSDGSKVTTPKTVTKVSTGVTGVTGGSGTAIPAGSTGTNNATGTSTTVTTTPTGGGGGGGTPTPTPTLTLDETSVRIGGNAVTKSGIYYEVDKDWTSSTALSARVSGVNFDADTQYPMKVVATASGGYTVSFEYNVTGSSMNVTDKEITQLNLIDNLTGANLIDDVNTMTDAWLTRAAVGDTVLVKIKNGDTVLFELNLKVVD